MNDQKNTDTSIEGAVSAAADLSFTTEAGKEKNEPYRLYLREDQIPTQYYNVRADMPEKPAPMRLPNRKAATFEDIRPVFCDELVRQERRRARDVQGVAPVSAASRLQPGTCFGDARQDLLQVRRQQHLGFA